MKTGVLLGRLFFSKGGPYMSEIHNATPKQEDLTEEEFIELVLEEQQKALAQEREERIHGKKQKNKSLLYAGLCGAWQWCCFSIRSP